MSGTFYSGTLFVPRTEWDELTQDRSAKLNTQVEEHENGLGSTSRPISIIDDDDDMEFPDIYALKTDNKDHHEALGTTMEFDELSEDTPAELTIVPVPLRQNDKFRRLVHAAGSSRYYTVSRLGDIEQVRLKDILRHVPARNQVNTPANTIVDDACLLNNGSKSIVLAGCNQEEKQLVSIALSSNATKKPTFIDRPTKQGKNAGVSAIFAMPDANKFVSGGHDHQVHLWSAADASSFALPKSHLLPMKHNSAVYAFLTLSDTSTKIISGGADCIINVCDVPSTRVVTSFKTSNSIFNVHEVASPFCTLLEVAHRDQQYEIRDYRTPERPVSRFGYDCQQSAGRFIRGASLVKSSLFACGDRQGRVRLWDMRNTARPVKQIVCMNKQKIAQVMFHDSERLLACTEDNHVILVKL
ncbi:WD40 repeat-like protein [Cylindrobasidium torrendii FP15055 ss-10]|uniref:WD40 repeat-like protein n=1 Tax=Cylindrobasidium torrendii FP15055 ss-10 TaxID=1314674 RepID=A0A0D7BQW5_9AGAR|nr:WD40 repeat-like protein [Cylindrobasidium torrendii FP15055 ss-10]